MIALLTSCGRHDLLQRTIDSLDDLMGEKLRIIIHEDPPLDPYKKYSGHFPKSKKHQLEIYAAYNKLGQHKSIQYMLDLPHVRTEKYVLMLEDDWHFDNSYNWICRSIEIMEHDPKIIKVLARKDSPHPCVHSEFHNGTPYGLLAPWMGADNILWHGFSWNPGVTRVDALREFLPFPKWEQELAGTIYKAGYKVAEIPGVYEHIGDGRSTHA